MITRRKFLETSTLAMGGIALAAGSGCNARSIEENKSMPFRIALNVSTIRPYKLPVDQQIDFCGAAGFDGIELWISDIQDYVDHGGSLTDLAAKLKNNNLILDNIIGFAPWSVDDENRREEGFLQMQREMEITATLGGKYIAAPVMGSNRSESGNRDDLAQRYLRIIEAGKTMGVTPLLELWGTGIVRKLADALYIALATEHADANLLLDFYHLYRGGNSFDNLNKINVAQLPVFHMNDYPATPPREQLRDSDRVYPGDGICPFDTLIPLLYKGGFRGAFSVELFKDEYCQGNTVEQVLATTIEKTRKVLTQWL
jgi:sugar phosphate isomerase/epimerase